MNQLAECDSGACQLGVAEEKLSQLREMYEPFLYGLSRHFLFALPPIVSDKPTVDNWQTSAWMKRIPGIGGLPAVDDEHFF
jgi:hypothetical protein